jgi:hypothetical protein
MAMTLDQWQQRLESHFAHLAATKAISGVPLFALEHGLTDDEFEEIQSLLHSLLTDGWKLGRYWLVWVVYATELGYDYDGGEYWPSFEQRTPRWREAVTSTRRNQLRTWFSKFQTTYQAVKPSGQWAEQFPIIAWPITHAILPTNLKWQFARTLYDLRYQLAHLESLSPNRVGQFLAANAWEASSRFREFLQQEELAGRIVLELLSDRTVISQSAIYPQTLERLVLDLEEVQSTREWLTETRRVVGERLKGFGRPGAQGYRDGERGDDNKVSNAPLHIRPTLILRRSGVSTWSVVIDIPSFASAARSQPDLYALTRSSRCKITGTGDTWLPSGWLLSSSRRRVVKNWPGSGAPLVTFERPNPDLDPWIARETRLSVGSTWLCRIGGDGLAHEIAGRMVRPGRRYILLSETEITCRYSFLAPCSVDCDGIYSVVLSMPDTVSFETMTALQQLGLQVSRTVQIWPAGLSGRGFDGEGRSEWLTTESPCFGIVHDHPVDAYSLCLNNGEETLIKATGVGIPIFAKMAPLPPGRHTLLVKTRHAFTPGATTSPPAQGVITLDVREPEPWIPGTTSHAGLAISLDPENPGLDLFWHGSVGVSILGPAGHQVVCILDLKTASGKEILAEQIGTFDLPVTPSDWFKKFQPFVEDERRTWTYLEATSGRFQIRGDELGEYSLRLERDVKPVRWMCRNTSRATTVRLIDDTGGDDIVACRFFSFKNPALPVNLDAEKMMVGFDVPVPGGIFKAQHGKSQDTINVSIPPNGRGFADLLIEPDVHELESETFPIIGILDAITLWSEARLLGPLVSMRRDRIIERLVNRLYRRLCGERWAEAEATYLASSHSAFDRQKLERTVGGPNGFSLVLGREYDRMEAGTASGKHWFAGVANRYQVCGDHDLCEFALQFSSHPYELPPIPNSILNGWLLEIKQKDVLLRGARLVTLLAANRNPGPFGAVFPRWKW